MGRPHDRVCPHKGAPRFERQPVLSPHYRNRLARAMPEYEEPEPPPDFQVAGPLTPQANGAYYETGVYNAKPYYRRRGGKPWFMWYFWHVGFAEHWWRITRELGATPDEYWVKSDWADDVPPGNYVPQAGAVGTAIVTAY